MDATQDKHGLDRSILAYRDISVQPAAKHYLIVDEGMGQKALFSVDGVQVTEFSVIGWRGTEAKPTQVIAFGPHLPWRMVNQSEVYLQDSKTVYEREAQERKEMHELETEFRKILKPVGNENERAPGQYV